MKRIAMGAVGLSLVLFAACAATPHPDSHTGADGKVTGAKPIALVANQATAHGIVTYPGGDRVDWKSIELPKNATGSLAVELRWTTPRPGLKVAFDVVDEWTLRCGKADGSLAHRGDRLKRTAMCAAQHDPELAHAEISKTRSSETASIKKAQGTYFVRVYAPHHGDAGTYQLVADFTPDPVTPTPPLPPAPPAPGAGGVATAHPPATPSATPVPTPPTTPAAPSVPCLAFDPANPTCKAACPAGSPASWAGCKDKCMDPPDPSIKACQISMACPRGGDRRVKSCTLASFPTCPDPKDPDPLNPKCDAQELVARVIGVSVTSSGQILTVAAGTTSTPQLTRTWTGYLVDENGKRLTGGDVTIIRVEKALTIVKTSLTLDQIHGANVKLIPPPRAPLL